MTTPTNDEQFWQLVDSFIALANDKAQTMDRNLIGPAIQFAGTRFNAYMLASATGAVEVYSQQKADAIAYYKEQHEKMLNDNFNDFEINFEKYRTSSHTER